MENKQENYYNSDFQHGYSMGIENVYKDKVSEETAPYEGFISSQVGFDWFQNRLSEKKTELNKIDTEIDSTKAKRTTLFEQYQTHAVGEQTATFHRNIAQKEFDDNQLKISNLESKKQKNETPYSLFSGILYLLAGVAFVAGDLIISHEIVAYALNIKNPTEAWAFAIGLAMLSVLLKPAYERLVEQPYITDYNAKTKKIYSVFQGVLLVFSIGTMLVLGWFRYEAYKTDRLKISLNEQIKTIQAGSQPLDAMSTQTIENQAVIQQLEEKMKAINQLNLDLVNSPWALFSFVLSGVLFAVAGAICLGIAFPIIHAYWFQWLQAKPAIKKARKQHIALKENLENAEKELAQQTIQKNIFEHELGSLPSLDTLKNERRAVVNEIDKILTDLQRFDNDRRIHTFTDGYERGEKNREEMSDSEYEEFRSSIINQIKHSQDSKNDSNPRVYRTNGLRPYQSIRKAIGNQLDNQN